jgi:hypothetical protein
VDSADLAFRLLPAALGLVLVAYAAYQVRKMEISYFSSATSWFVALFIASVLFLCLFEIVDNSAGERASNIRAKVDATFAIFTMWLSTCAVSLAAVYRRHNLADDFWAFLRARPLNLISAWGLVALALIVVVWISRLHFLSSSLEENSGLLLAVSSYLAAAVMFDIALPWYARARGEIPHTPRGRELDSYLLAAAWIMMPFTTLGLDVFLGAGLKFQELNPYLWAIVVLLSFMVRSMTASKFSALRVESEVETSRREGFRAYDIPRGIYLVYDEKADSALSLFSELVTLPLRPDAAIPVEGDSAIETLEFLIPRGLVVSRAFPDELRGKYGLHATPIVWLTESVGEMRIAPTSLALLTDTLMRFMENNHNSIVLVEGVEYAVTFNDFRKVLRSLDVLNETAWITKARLMIAINPSAFDEKERALLERDRAVLIGRLGIEELKRESMVSRGAG